MPECEVCGNDYDKAFEVKVSGKTHIFDSLECAAEIIAPRCEHCECRILGHGLESAGKIFCCAHCAGKMGHPELRDRSEAGRTTVRMST